MFVLTNAWRAVTRRWVTSALTVVVALLVSFGSIVSLSVLQEHSDAHGTDYNAQTPNAVIRPTAATKADMKGDDASITSKYLTIENYGTYATAAQTQGVSFTYTLAQSVPVRQSSSIKAIPGSADESADKTGGEFTLLSMYTGQAKKANEYGNYTVVEGKKLNGFQDTTSQSALISKSVAEKNNLKPGDKFKVGDPSDSSKTYEFTVRGIYEYDDDSDGGNGTYSKALPKLAKDNRENVIYTTYAAVYGKGLDPQDVKDGSWSKPDLNVIFQFTDVATYNKFVKLAKKAKLPKGYELTSPILESYEASVAPLDSLAAKVRPALWVLAIGGCVALLALAVARSWFGRTEEIGMALVSGVTKPRLGWQFMVESFILTVIPVAVGLLAGGFGAKAIGSALASGHATPVTSSIVWTMVWDGLALIVVLAVVAMLRPATFRNAALFQAADAGKGSVGKADSADKTAESDDKTERPSAGDAADEADDKDAQHEEEQA
ncbi:ABC transporter permease [Bifidobacterium sp. CP2]|uniref:ABC transporter permease n=1 Tax=Bifidobacterium sp. CP2 TaxID=2809025 RepID=UPI001F0AA168|nr:ABC transporter permease [Bifidobacterium sp. CP2]